MKPYNDAAELALAFSSVMKEMRSEMESLESVPISDDEEYQSLQVLISRLIMLQRDLDEFIERAITLESLAQERPYQVLDFSSEWEGF